MKGSTMEPAPDIQQFLEMLARAQDVLVQSLPNIEDPAVKKYVSELSRDLDQRRGDLAKVLPEAIRQIEADMAAIQESAADLKRRAEEWQEQLAAAEAEAAPAAAAAAAPAAQPKPAPVKKAATAIRPPVHAADNDGSVWRDDNASTWESSTQGSEVPSAPLPPPRPHTPPAWDPNESVRDIDESRPDENESN
jgi:hypothetical protein